MDTNLIQQLQHQQQLRLKQQDVSARQETDQVKFDKKLLDFDYGSEDEDDNAAPSPQPQQSTGLERYASVCVRSCIKPASLRGM